MSDRARTPRPAPRPSPPTPPEVDHQTTPPTPYKGGVVSGVGKTTGAGRSWLDERVTVSRRAARHECCRSCGTAVLVGDDDDRCAVRVAVDAEPVSHVVEVVELLRGAHSYNVIARAGQLVISHRDIEAVRIAARHPIHLRHQCTERK
jgi:hypothetical protein